MHTYSHARIYAHAHAREIRRITIIVTTYIEEAYDALK